MDKFKKKSPKTGGSGKSKNIGVIALSVAVILALAAFGYMFMQYKSAQSRIDELLAQTTQPQMSDEEVRVILDGLAKHMIIPDESPSVATIADAAKAAEQDPFFKDTVDGDVALFFPENKKAIVYSQSRDIVVNAGPLYINQDAAQQPDQGDQQNQKKWRRSSRSCKHTRR